MVLFARSSSSLLPPLGGNSPCCSSQICPFSSLASLPATLHWVERSCRRPPGWLVGKKRALPPRPRNIRHRKVLYLLCYPLSLVGPSFAMGPRSGGARSTSPSPSVSPSPSHAGSKPWHGAARPLSLSHSRTLAHTRFLWSPGKREVGRLQHACRASTVCKVQYVCGLGFSFSLGGIGQRRKGGSHGGFQPLGGVHFAVVDFTAIDYTGVSLSRASP